MKQERLKSFFTHLPYLTMEELIGYFAVFDGFDDLALLKEQETLLKNVEHNILHRYATLSKIFDFTADPDQNEAINRLLYRLAIGTRKHYSIYKDLSKERGSEAYRYLFAHHLIETELSRETPILRHPKQLLKKEHRGYKIENKVRFSYAFYRFWFTFIYPDKEDLAKGVYNPTLKRIEEGLDRYISVFFEEISNLLLEQIYAGEILDSGSYWDREVEIDLWIRLIEGGGIVGECKWKNHKVSKNILNKLKKVSQKVGFDVRYYALFSKSGFSKELENLKENELLLYDLDDFKRLLQ